MNIQEFEDDLLYPRHTTPPYTQRHRSTIIIALCAILGLVGSLTLMAQNTGTHSSPISYTATQFALAHPQVSTPQSQPIQSAATPTPTPTHPLVPNTPFPTVLWQEIAALQAQNRFLYYGNPYVPEVALTFDDGPNPYYTPQVLAVLQQYNVKATFFCIGRQVAAYPYLVKQEYAAGNLIGNHSWSHPNLALLSSDDISTQINSTSDAIQQAIGVRPTFFRPPYGVINANVLTQANLLKLTTIIWNDEARDWTTPGVDVITSRILNLAGDGAIILLHDGGGNRSQTVAALPTIITSLQASGFKLVTLQQMVHDLPLRPASNSAPTSISGAYPTPTPTTPSETIPTPTPTTTSTPTTLIPTLPAWKQGI